MILLKLEASKFGIASAVIEGVAITLTSVACWTASLLVMDEQYIAALDSKRFADQQNRAEQQGSLAIARAQQAEAKQAAKESKKKQKAVRNLYVCSSVWLAFLTLT